MPDGELMNARWGADASPWVADESQMPLRYPFELLRMSSTSKSPKRARMRVTTAARCDQYPSITGPSCTKNMLEKARMEMKKT